MNALANTPYGSVFSPAKDPRSAEAALLSRITVRLRKADRERDFPDFAAALEDNRRFWAMAAFDLASDGNRLPDELRARLISIAAFVMAHTTRILTRNAETAALLDINHAVISGLTAEGAVT